MSLVADNWYLFLVGLGNTLRIGIVTLLASTVLGFVVGTLATSTVAPLRWAARLYVEMLRAIPLIVNLFFVYFVAPLLGLALSPYAAVIVGLSLWGGANAAEIVRGGLLAVPRQQAEAARALGLHTWQVLALVVMPQALRAIVPALAGLLTLLVQSTSLGALVGLSEFFRIGQLVIERSTVMQGLDPAFAIYGFMLAVYFALCSALSAGTRWLERRLSAGGTHRVDLPGL